MTGTGLVLFGGPQDGLPIATARDIERANRAATPYGKYVFTERRARDGRLILTYTPTPTPTTAEEATP